MQFWIGKKKSYEGHYRESDAICCYCCLVAKSCPTFCDPRTVARQSSLSMGFSRQEYWSGLPFPSPGNFPDPGVEPRSPALADSFFTSEPPGKSSVVCTVNCD